MLKVRDRMIHGVDRIHRDQEVYELEELLPSQGAHPIPVVDEAERIVGMISQPDLLAWHFEHCCKPEENTRISTDRCHGTPVVDLMSPRIYCIGPERPLTEAAARMVRERILHLFVIDENYEVVGILSAGDLLDEIPGVAERLSRSA